MIALQLTDIKNFVNTLLKTDCFDNFLMTEALITKDATFVIDGHITKDFYSEEELENEGLSGLSILPFSRLRANCFDLIKGKRAPEAFKFVFQLSPENLAKTLNSINSSYSVNDIAGIFINIKYQNKQLTLTSGVSYKIFSTDKSLENEWDILIKKFLKSHQIEYEEL